MTLPSAPATLAVRAADGPAARVLSNGRLTSLVTAEGTGFVELAGQRVTSWTQDALESHEGVLCYVRDEEDGALWSLGLEPVPGAPERYEARGEPGALSLLRRERGIETCCEITVHAVRSLELRRVRIANAGARPRRLSLTSQLGIVLHAAAAHAAHPAFSKLFVETSVDAAAGVLLARRRPRGPAPEPLHLAHALFGPGAASFETDRARFFGRGRSHAEPAALDPGARLSGSVGNVLDPIASWRRELALAPGETCELLVVLALGESETSARALALEAAAPGAFEAARTGAAGRARAELERAGLAPGQGAYLEELLARMLHGAPALRAAAEVFRRVAGAPEELAALGLAPGRPLVVLEPGPAAAALARELAAALAYWSRLGVAVQALVPAGAPVAGEGVVAAREDADPRLLEVARACAALVLGAAWPAPVSPPARAPEPRFRPGRDPDAGPPFARGPLRLANGTGGFSADGREYVIELPADGALPPLPWVNVLANPEFGTLVSERGAAHTWSRNSREHRLTPWSNDPVLDPHGEALFLRDETAGTFWSPPAGPVPGGGRAEVRHGFGTTRWRRRCFGLEQEVTTLVASEAPVKLTRVRLVNLAGAARRLSLFAYARLVLGEDVAHATVTRLAADGRTLLAANGLAGAFREGVAFASVSCAHAGAALFHGADRLGFVGVGGAPERPRALAHDDALDGRTGAGLAPCFAHQVRLELAPGASAEVVFALGEGRDAAHAEALAARCGRPGAFEEALAGVHESWEGLLGALRVETPSAALDPLLNGWLAYQTVACRLWGRTAFSQSGGAFGYRDQLQDAAALVHARPDLTRAQILLHAAHQFVEGDVLHWWHPPHGRGTRTRFADDLLWLPWVTARYVAATGDRSVLDEPAGFVTARPLAEGEDEAYLETAPAPLRASVYEHCCRAIERSLAIGMGEHGLPRMGSGDWNDGMNRVGREGRGESVWMAFFLCDVLRSFEPLCAGRGDAARAERYAAVRAALARAVEEHAWDGAWYLRAWFDDGTPLGGAGRSECRIDLLPQAWAVLSGAAPRARAERAMEAVERELLLPEGRLIRLLAPPFDRSEPSPGYIQGYVPGIRENGGQYTHAACWAVRAAAELGWRERALAWLEWLLPTNHARTPAEVARYRAEPYVVAADVYAVPPHVGRGGWTWYTGSAGWLLRVALESVLGLSLEAGERLVLRPCVPDAWPGFRIDYRLPDGRTRYAIEVRSPAGSGEAVVSVRLDGRPLAPREGAAVWPITHDGAEHRVEVELGPR